MILYAAALLIALADAPPGTYPNPTLTPGVADPAATAAKVCTPGYTATVRHVPASVKLEVFRRYGIDPALSGQYEVDHDISLELGGSNDIMNLWPEKYEQEWGARKKDVVETNLHRRICKGEITIEMAQAIIRLDWVAEYRRIKGLDKP